MVTDGESLYFCRGRELRCLLPFSSPHPLACASPPAEHCWLRYITLSLRSLLQIQGAGEGFGILCVISWSSSDYINRPLAPRDPPSVTAPCESSLCRQHHSSCSSVFAARALIRGPQNTRPSNVQSFIVYFSFPKTSSGFKEYACKARGELKGNSPNRETGRHLFSVCACWHLSPAGPGAGVSEKQNQRRSDYWLNDMVDWILNKAGSLCRWHQSCHSICSNIPQCLVNRSAPFSLGLFPPYQRPRAGRTSSTKGLTTK